jgi:hypothetical protein
MLDQGLLAEVARQVFEGQETIATPAGPERVQRTSKQRLRRVEFVMGEEPLIGIEQNPNTASRWAQLAREGHKVMQFRDARTGAYVANVVDGKVTFYHRRREN